MQRIYRGYPQALHMAEIEQQLYQGDGVFPGVIPEEVPYRMDYGQRADRQNFVDEQSIAFEQSFVEGQSTWGEQDGSWTTPENTQNIQNGFMRPTAGNQPASAQRPTAGNQAASAQQPAAGNQPASTQQPAAQPTDARPDTQAGDKGGMQPYMVYRRENQQEEPNQSQALRMELDYFKSLCPLAMKKRQVLVDEVCDHMDYDNSPMYDEYPDRVSIYQMRDGVCRHAREAGLDADEDLTLILLLHEIGRRRLLKKN